MQLHPETSSADLLAGPATTLEAEQEGAPSRVRSRLLWAAGIASLLLLLIFIPPLINANRYRRQIARSMSDSLGRPVHLDSVTLRLLPVPGLTLTNLVVSEDPAFGDEPTIRANTVEATLRLGSLWRRRVEFSSVRFIEPSVNLVRNSAGRWNLANVLLHAAHVNTAPTVQRRAGPAPRFPYIEATGGRVNIKLAEEKLPFALTDADFALWLPSPQQWRVRLEGQPARTDAYITDPGTLRIEGTLQRATMAAAVPVNLRATWHDAPMGEATRLLTGDDMGWRGTWNLDATLDGTLGASQVTTRLTLGGVRRADFAPAHPLDLQANCRAALAIVEVTFTDLACTMPDGAGVPMALHSANLNLQHPEQASAALDADHIPVHWGMLWAALFSARVPTDLHPAGTMALHLQHLPAVVSANTPGPRQAAVGGRHPHPVPAITTKPTAGELWTQWTGTLELDLPPAPGMPQPTADAADLPNQLLWRLVPSTPTGLSATPGLQLQPVTIHLAPDAAVALRASVTQTGYDLSVDGSASPAALLLPARYLPQLGDGLEGIIPFPPTRTAAARVQFTCTHPWNAAQTCTSARPAPPSGRPLIMPQTTTQQPRNSPTLLTPRSLSPLDRDPQLGGPPPAGASPQAGSSPPAGLSPRL